MTTLSSKLAVKWGSFVVKHKWTVFILTTIISLFLASNGKMAFDSDYHVFFSEENPELEAFDALQEKYTKDDNIILVLAAKNGDIFTKENLAAIEELTAESWNTPYSSRVDAITNYQHTKANGDDLYVDDLAYESISKTDEEIKEIREIALKEPLLINRLINETGSVTAINITLTLPGVDTASEIPEVTKASRKMIADFKAKHPQFDIYTTGMVPMNIAFFEASYNDLGLTAIMFLIVIGFTFFLTRNIFATLATLVVIFFSISSSVGFVGLMDIKLTPPSALFPTMILTLAIADSVHILISILQKMRRDKMDKKSAIIESIRLNLSPVFITSFTTVIGFLTFNFGDVPPFWDLGNIGAFGMTMAFFYSITTLPALMAIFPVKKSRKVIAANTGKPNGFYTRFGQFVIERPRSLTTISLAIVLILGFLAQKNVFNDEFVEYFDKTVKFRTDSDFINDNLTGFYNVEFSVGSGESGGINNPEYLKNLSKFESWLKEQPSVVHVNAFTEIARRINRSMHGDDQSYYRIPDSREESAQYLLLYELSLPFGLDLNNQINVDKSETRVTVTLKNTSSVEIIALAERAQEWLQNNTPSYMHAIGVSPTLMFSRLGFRQADGMFNGNVVALILITIVLIIALRSFKLGLLSLIPNISPVMIGFGLWWIYKETINSGMVIVFGMTLGIIVDDTVHFMSKFLRAKNEYGYDTRKAILYAFETVGEALVTTTIILMGGFTILSTSHFAMNSYMARITLIIIVAALLIDVILLPSLLLLTSKDKNKLKHNH